MFCKTLPESEASLVLTTSSSFIPEYLTEKREMTGSGFKHITIIRSQF